MDLSPIDKQSQTVPNVWEPLPQQHLPWPWSSSLNTIRECSISFPRALVGSPIWRTRKWNNNNNPSNPNGNNNNNNDSPLPPCLRLRPWCSVRFVHVYSTQKYFAMSSSPPLPAKNLGKGSLPVGKSNGAVLSRARSRPSEEANLEQSDPHNVNQSVKVCPRRKFSNSVVSCRNGLFDYSNNIWRTPQAYCDVSVG